jgi:endo-1,4-beta-xylanase
LGFNHFTESTTSRIADATTKGTPLKIGVYGEWGSGKEGKERQAREVTELYTTLFQHPAVMAITWWDLSDQGSYREVPTGLLRCDMVPKPAYQALQHLIKAIWWTHEEAIVSEGGIVSFTGVKGDYTVTISGNTNPLT